MTLKEFLKNYVLTKGQNTLIEELENYLSDNLKCLSLRRYAGNRKTCMMNGLTVYLTSINRIFKITATI